MKSVVLTGDWHITDHESAFFIAQNIPKGSHLILMGDLVDAGIDRGMNWNQPNVTAQIDTLQALLSEYKVEGYVLGNHELRIQKKIGLNPYHSFLGNETVEYGINGRCIVVEHGTKVLQNPITQLKELATINPQGDVIALGHDHTLGIWTHINKYRNQWLVRTGNLMKEYPTYARRSVLYPKPTGYVRYDLKHNKPEIIMIWRRL